MLRVILLELLYSQEDQIHFLSIPRIKLLFTLLENVGMNFRVCELSQDVCKLTVCETLMTDCPDAFLRFAHLTAYMRKQMP